MNQEPQGTGERWMTVAIGTLFVAIAVSIVLSYAGGLPLGALVATVIIGGLGFEALVSAVRRRRCLLSRIGPLP